MQPVMIIIIKLARNQCIEDWHRLLIVILPPTWFVLIQKWDWIETIPKWFDPFFSRPVAMQMVHIHYTGWLKNTWIYFADLLPQILVIFLVHYIAVRIIFQDNFICWKLIEIKWFYNHFKNIAIFCLRTRFVCRALCVVLANLRRQSS